MFVHSSSFFFPLAPSAPFGPKKRNGRTPQSSRTCWANSSRLAGVPVLHHVSSVVQMHSPSRMFVWRLQWPSCQVTNGNYVQTNLVPALEQGILLGTLSILSRFGPDASRMFLLENQTIIPYQELILPFSVTEDILKNYILPPCDTEENLKRN
jgi:hypothetical protein